MESLAGFTRKPGENLLCTNVENKVNPAIQFYAANRNPTTIHSAIAPQAVGSLPTNHTPSSGDYKGLLLQSIISLLSKQLFSDSWL